MDPLTRLRRLSQKVLEWSVRKALFDEDRDSAKLDRIRDEINKAIRDLEETGAVRRD